jgi:hypothetical protein
MGNRVNFTESGLFILPMPEGSDGDLLFEEDTDLVEPIPLI